jgi:LCP family protein required for cell wall assembly
VERSTGSTRQDASGGAPPPRRAAAAGSATKPRRRGVERLLISLGALATVGVLLTACTLGYFNWRLGQISRVDLNLARVAAGQPQNYLIVGSDSRAGITKSDPNSGAFLDDPQYSGNNSSSGQRSDSIMVLRIDPSKSTAQMLSLPRDLYVPIAGTNRSDRINAAFGIGRKTLIQTIQDQFDITINHYAEVDFVGFQRLVNAIGGLPMYIDKPLWDGNTGLYIPSAGCHTLDGTQALNFARSRHLWYLQGQTSTTADPTSLHYASSSQLSNWGWTYDGTSDLGRISRQQLLIRTAIPLAEHKAFRNPATLNAIMRSVVDSVTLDSGLSTSDLLGLAERFKGFDASSLVTYAYPTTPKTLDDADRTQVLIPDTARAEPILARFRGGSTSPESAVTVKVLNASGIARQAANVAGALDRVGFMIDGTADASTEGIDDLATTQVRYDPSDAAAAELVASHLSAPVKLTPTAGLTKGTVEVVTGKDFTTVSTTTRTLTAAEQPATAPTTTRGATSSSSSSTVVGVVPTQNHSC